MKHLCVSERERTQLYKRIVRKCIYIESNEVEDLRNEVFLNDYTPSLNTCMNIDEYGFWHSAGKSISLENSIPNKIFYRKDWIEVPYKEAKESRRDVLVRESVNQCGLSVIILSPFKSHPSPAVVICLGGPLTPIPNIHEEDSIYQTLIESGFTLIIPLRRGVVGISPEWEAALENHYGEYDVQDTIEATRFAAAYHPEMIDKNRIYLYGGSYGGYVAELIAGKCNADRLFKAIIAHCGIYDLATYPWHNKGIPEETMQTYGHTTNRKEYSANVAKISPKSFVDNWDVPILLIHHLNDMSSWFGQSVAAYNDALMHGKHVDLLIVPGPHTYEVKHRDVLFRRIVSFFTQNKVFN